MEALRSVGLHSRASPLRQLCQRCYASLRGSQLAVPWQYSTPPYQPVQRHPFCTVAESVTQPQILALKGARLTSRSLILVKGRDAAELLQGLMTNDIELLDNEGGGQEAIYSMFLNKQGRVLYDVMCYRWVKGHQEDYPAYLLECDSAISPDLHKHLKFYRIRKKVDIAPLDSEYHIWTVFGQESPPPPHAAPDSHLCRSLRVADPRVKGLGQRVIIPQGNSVSGVDEVLEEDYSAHRYQWGVAEGVNELPPGDCLPLEANLALMNGVSFIKGCYLGQELTARTHHTGVIRKRIMPVELLSSGTCTFTSGSTIKTKEGKNVGKLRCHLHRNGLALLRTALIGNKLWISQDGGKDTELVARRPSWWPEEITNK